MNESEQVSTSECSEERTNALYHKQTYAKARMQQFPQNRLTVMRSLEIILYKVYVKSNFNSAQIRLLTICIFSKSAYICLQTVCSFKFSLLR